MPIPSTSCSGTPSRKAPSASAEPASFSVVPSAVRCPPRRGRVAPPRCSIRPSSTKYVTAPAPRPTAVQPRPPASTPSWASSRLTALISAPAPKASTSPTCRSDHGRARTRAARRRTSEAAASEPQRERAEHRQRLMRSVGHRRDVLRRPREAISRWRDARLRVPDSAAHCCAASRRARWLAPRPARRHRSRQHRDPGGDPERPRGRVVGDARRQTPVERRADGRSRRRWRERSGTLPRRPGSKLSAIFRIRGSRVAGSDRHGRRDGRETPAT